MAEVVAVAIVVFVLLILLLLLAMMISVGLTARRDRCHCSLFSFTPVVSGLVACKDGERVMEMKGENDGLKLNPISAIRTTTSTDRQTISQPSLVCIHSPPFERK